MDRFGPALAGASCVVLTDIYPAGEAPLPEADVEKLAAAIRKSGTAVELVKKLEDVPAALAAIVQRGDVVITLGAGSISTTAAELLERLSPGAREGTARGDA